jgi:hypothetical protein
MKKHSSIFEVWMHGGTGFRLLLLLLDKVGSSVTLVAVTQPQPIPEFKALLKGFKVI